MLLLFYYYFILIQQIIELKLNPIIFSFTKITDTINN